MELIVEVLGTTNNVLERQKFSKNAVAIGRGFSNDLILNDEHADAEHARLELDDEGRWWIVDQNSVNGIRQAKGKRKLDRQAVSSGEVFLLGRNKLRVYLGNHPVPPAVRIRWIESLLLWLGKPFVLVSMILSYLTVKALASYFSTIGEFKWSAFFSQNIGEVLGFIALAIAVYFLSVLFRRGGNFMSHISVLVAVFLIGALIDFLINLAVFNAGDHRYGLINTVDTISGYLIIFLYLWSVLYLAFHFSLKQRTWISLVVLGGIVLLNVLQDQMMDEWFDMQSFPVEQTLLPPTLLLTEPINAEQYANKTEAAFDRVDELRIEALDEREESEQAMVENAQAVSESL
ncbi:MAG: FHA domain-containing protein [Pseudomonadota bacterium]